MTTSDLLGQPFRTLEDRVELLEQKISIIENLVGDQLTELIDDMSRMLGRIEALDLLKKNEDDNERSSNGEAWGNNLRIQGNTEDQHS